MSGPNAKGDRGYNTLEVFTVHFSQEGGGSRTIVKEKEGGSSFKRESVRFTMGGGEYLEERKDCGRLRQKQKNQARKKAREAILVGNGEPEYRSFPDSGKKSGYGNTKRHQKQKNNKKQTTQRTPKMRGEGRKRSIFARKAGGGEK